MRLLIVSDVCCDLSEVLKSCGVYVQRIGFQDAVYAELSGYDAFCILPKECGTYLEPRFRQKLERENDKGKRVFLQGVRSFQDYLYEKPEDTTRSRLIYLEPEEGKKISGLRTGDLLDDEANMMCVPQTHLEDMKGILYYKEHIIAHTHTDMTREEIQRDSRMGLWECRENILCSAFILRNFNKARFAPRRMWQSLISYIAWWLTGKEPVYFPEPAVRYGTKEDIKQPEIFERSRRESIERGIAWLNRFLIDSGRGGIREGMHHNVNPDGVQEVQEYVRTDCTGECAGAYKMYARQNRKKEYARRGEDMDAVIYGPMMVRGGVCDGMVRWCMNSWSVCYQDDVARALLPGLYDCLFMDDGRHLQDICSAMDFLQKTTAKDGLRIWRTDKYDLNPQSIEAIAEEEHGIASAHYNAYYHAALLLAGKAAGRNDFIDTAKNGLESLMRLYPNTAREQSETEEMCRMILPLSILYGVTGEEKHRKMLYRVAEDLQKVRHPFGGYMEWDTGYKAACSRESTGECSVLTKNGDPIADLLYSSNWLPLGFAFAYDVTGDEWFQDLWHEAVIFCMKTQMYSEDPLVDGSWCRAFDMELKEAYAAPHDVGWAAYASETGWTVAEILMGMMMPEILAEKKKSSVLWKNL